MSQRWGVWVAAIAALVAAGASVYGVVLTGDAARATEVREQRREVYSAFLQAERELADAAREFFIRADRHVDQSPDAIDQLTQSHVALLDASIALQEAVADIELDASLDASYAALRVFDSYQALTIAAGYTYIAEVPQGAGAVINPGGPAVPRGEALSGVARARAEFLTVARDELGTAD